MDKKVENIAKNFSKRLASQLKKRGLNSTRSSTGVNYTQLAHAIGCSKQMTRRYLLGEALPDHKLILKIASWLNVSPGWLLFGESRKNFSHSSDTESITIDYDLLQYILLKVSSLYSSGDEAKEIVDFTLTIIRDASCIDANHEVIRKIVDMAVESAERFQKSKELPSAKRRYVERNHAG